MSIVAAAVPAVDACARTRTTAPMMMRPTGAGGLTKHASEDTGHNRRMMLGRSGGNAAPSTRSIRARSRIPTATAWAISPGSPRTSTISRRCRRGDLAVADLPLADGRLRLRRLRLLRRRPGLRHARGPRRADRGLPRARDQARAGLGAQPQLRPAPVVPRVQVQPREPQARLVRLARRQGRRAAERLGLGLHGRRPRVDLRRGHRAVVPALVHARAARPQLGEPRGRRGDARRAALLDGPRRRRPAPGRDRQDRQGPAPARPQAHGRAVTTRTGSRSTATCAASAR